MWQLSLLEVIAKLSKNGTTLTTYSVAGSLRQNLSAAGFDFSKIPGYASKRHMLLAQMKLPVEMQTQATRSVDVEFAGSGMRDRTVCIIGAGLAGCSTAFALAQNGWQVVVLEREPDIARHGSGNAQGILHYRPSKADTAERQFNLHAYLYAIRHYRKLSTDHGFTWDQCGMLQLAVNAKLLARYEALMQSGQYSQQILQLLDAAAATEIAGRTMALPGLYLPGSGWMSPRALCELYLQHPLIKLQTGAEVFGLESASNGWKINVRINNESDFFETNNVVLCNAANVYDFSQTRHFPIVCNLGQVDYYVANAASSTRTVLCGQGYILPSNGECQSVGGSFFVGDQGIGASASRRVEHVRAVQAMAHDVGAALEHSNITGQRIGMRCATPDRMPIVGAVTQPESTKKLVLPGLYLNVAHGSHGITRTPLCAAYLVSLLNRIPFPLGNDVAAVIRPDRFQAG